MTNKLPIPGSKGYTVDIETHAVYNAKGRHMRPHVDKRKRVCTKIMLETGSQRTIIIKDVVRNLLRDNGISFENQALRKSAESMLVQLTTYHTVLLHSEEVRKIEGNEARWNFFKDMDVELDLGLVSVLVQIL